MLLISVNTQKVVNALVNTKSIAMKCPNKSATTYFSSRKINTIAPLYKRLLEIVCESLRERIDAHPFFFTLLHIPKAVSKMINKTAIITKGFIGAKIVSTEKANIDNLVFIFN
jgi:hypothetical protein